jgi:hypothetical protein
VTSLPLIPGDGIGNQTAVRDLSRRLGKSVHAVDESVVGALVRRFIEENRALLGIDTAQLGGARVVPVNADLWQISIPQVYRGLRVRHARLAATISHGNLVLIGTESWGDVAIDAVPRVAAKEAMDAGFVYAEGRSFDDEILREPTLEIVPVAPLDSPAPGSARTPTSAARC